MAFIERYVVPTGKSANGGTNDTTDAWDLATGFNNCGTGVRLNIKAGNYTTNTLNFTAAGTPTSALPCHVRGYASVTGDGYLGRNSSGYLITTNMPTITFNAGQSVTFNKPHMTFESLNLVANCNNQLIGISNDCIVIVNCVINNVNSNNNANAYCVYNNHLGVNCDYIVGGTQHYGCVYGETGPSFVGCNFVGNGYSSSIGIAYVRQTHISNCTFRNFNIAINRNTTSTAGSHELFIHNTFYNIATAVYKSDNAASNETTHTLFLGNHATDCGRFIQYTSANRALLMNNRTRDNTNTNSNMGESLDLFSVTTDNGGPETDYVVTGINLTLKDNAAGRNRSLFSNRDIGALQAPLTFGVGYGG